MAKLPMPSGASLEFLVSSATLRNKYESLIKTGSDPSKSKEAMGEIRQLIALEGIPPESDDEKKIELAQSITLRGRIWKLILGIGAIDTPKYLELCAKGQSRLFEKIESDVNRTFMGNKEFKRRVGEGYPKLGRLLNAYQHYIESISRSEIDPTHEGHPLDYCQGLNLVAGMFLFVMPEPDAFFSFCAFIENCCPRYASQQIKGVYEGVEVFDKVLEHVDKDLHTKVIGVAKNPAVYAQLPIQSMGLHWKPIEEVFKLWDLIIAYGVHMSIVFALSEIILRREEYLKDPKKLLQYKSGQNAKDLEAAQVINLAFTLLSQIPATLFDALVKHSIDTINPYLTEWEILSKRPSAVRKTPSKRSSGSYAPTPSTTPTRSESPLNDYYDYLRTNRNANDNGEVRMLLNLHRGKSQCVQLHHFQRYPVDPSSKSLVAIIDELVALRTKFLGDPRHEAVQEAAAALIDANNWLKAAGR